ncbi:Cancer-related nucleoside-triphosphatase [Lamellibrachia satsuma]|nr:Cancer-related nucleoside-triphosphatase [Lamellibrachia satsuma]
MASSNVKRQILLTGPPGVGKTTIVRKVCKRLQDMGVPMQGFYTEEVRIEGKRTGFDVVSLSGNRGKLARVSPDNGMGGGRSRYSVGQYSVLLDDFEETALPVLQANTDQGATRPVYVIDEIGKMEMFSSRFVQTVRTLTAQVETTVLATIPIAKGRPVPLVEELRHSADAKLMVISRANREEVVAEVVQSVLDAHRHT